MGLGDQLLGSGMARGAKARGKRIAFGDGRKILWDKHSETVFRNNPNIAAPGTERRADIEWVPFYKGSRLYNRQDGDRWAWNMDFRPTPGEIFQSPAEIRDAKRYGEGFILIEPNVEAWKSSAANKDWGLARYQAVAEGLKGHRLVQFAYGKQRLNGVSSINAGDFRDAVGIMRHAALYIGPEGGLHHGAAAMGTKAVVLFGGFIPPAVTGYEGHANLTGGAEACGSLKPCQHCRRAMEAISVEDVLQAARERLDG